MSSWLRDYLYIPLGGSRDGQAKRDRNLFLTMLLGGLWHGAAWPFVVWGAYQGAGLVVERRLVEWRADRQPNPWATPLKWLATFHFVCLGWLFFRAETLADAWNMLGRLFTSFLEPAPSLNSVFIAVAISALFAQLLSRSALARLQVHISQLPVWAMVLGFGVWMLIIDQFGPDGVAAVHLLPVLRDR